MRVGVGRPLEPRDANSRISSPTAGPNARWRKAALILGRGSPRSSSGFVAAGG